MRYLRHLIFLLFLVFTISSCEKDYLIPKSEVPDWLRKRIAQDEKEIKSNPQSGLDIAAWIRYEYLDNYYFEYHNLLSSAGPVTYDYDGVIIMLNQEPYLNYNADKCCKQYVWKGPSYIEY